MLSGGLIFILSVIPTVPVQAEGRTYTLQSMIEYAIEDSAEQAARENLISQKQMEYEIAQETIKRDQKWNTEYEWTPWIDLNLPEGVDLFSDFENTMKPFQISYEIDVLSSRLVDQRKQEALQIAEAYIDCYEWQELCQEYEEQVKKQAGWEQQNRSQLFIGKKGLEKQELDQMKSLGYKMLLEKARLQWEDGIAKLENLTGITLSTEDILLDPCTGIYHTVLTKTQLESIIQQSHEYDLTYVEQLMEYKLLQLSMETNYRLMRKQFGSQMEHIRIYIDMVENGETVQADICKKVYDSVLQNIAKSRKTASQQVSLAVSSDNSISMQYIKEDPYVLLRNIMDYQSLRAKLQQADHDLSYRIQHGYNQYQMAWKEYESAKQEVAKWEDVLQKNQYRIRFGYASLESEQDWRAQYDASKIACQKKKIDYVKSFYALDRITYGELLKVN